MVNVRVQRWYLKKNAFFEQLMQRVSIFAELEKLRNQKVNRSKIVDDVGVHLYASRVQYCS